MVQERQVSFSFLKSSLSQQPNIISILQQKHTYNAPLFLKVHRHILLQKRIYMLPHRNAKDYALKKSSLSSSFLKLIKKSIYSE